MDLRFPGLHSCVSPHGDVIGSLNIMYSRWNLFFRFYSILKKKKKRQSPVKEAGEEWARLSCEWGSATLSRNEVERGQAGAGMHGEVKCEGFVSSIWMGSGVVTGARSDRGAMSRAQRLCRASGFQVRILGTSLRSGTLTSMRSPRSSPDCWWQGWVTAPGRHKVKVLEGLQRLKVPKRVKGSYEVHCFQISIGTWL